MTKGLTTAEVSTWMKEHGLVAISRSDAEDAADALQSAGEEIRRLDPTVKLTGWDMDPALPIRLRAACR